jgi:hypothetical protein
MEGDLFIIAVKSIVLFIYGIIFIISIIFTFFIDAYNRLEGILNLEFGSAKIVNPLSKNIDFVNNWLIANNKIVGPVLILLSLADIFLLFGAINSL